MVCPMPRYSVNSFTLSNAFSIKLRCHVSTKHIANIEKGSMNPSYEILLAIARVLPISLDALITPGMGKTEIELKEFNRIYLSCPEAVREALMDSTRTLAKHLTEFYSKIENP